MGLEKLKVLLIEDNPGDARLIRELLNTASAGQFVLEAVERLSDGIERLEKGSFAAVLLDLSLAESRGIDTFRALHESTPGIPVVVLTGSNDDALAAEALQAGAQDYLVKGQVDRNMLARSLRYAVERGRIEEQLRQRAVELAESGRRKDEFLAILSHELRNPLSPLVMAVQWLRKPDLEDGEREWAQDMIERQVGTITRLIDDLLDVSRISRGKITLRKEPMDLSSAIHRAVETTRPLFDENHHQLNLSLPGQAVPVDGDPVRLEQVIVNLLTNAAKYTHPGGRVWVSASVDNGEAILRVRDTGVGIPAPMLEPIFELFTRVDSSTDRSFQWGMGVGLALARGLLELHGGTIKACSPGPGGGSEFVIRLPLLLNAQSAGQLPSTRGPAREKSTNGGPCKVLIAEDHPDSAHSLALILKSWGHEVRIANDGSAALAMALELLPNVVLLDIGLPGMTGYEVARRLRDQAIFSNTLILALTGYGRDEDRQRAAEAGFNSHLTKPVNLETLRKLIATQMCNPQHSQT